MIESLKALCVHGKCLLGAWFPDRNMKTAVSLEVKFFWLREYAITKPDQMN
jgi:hypothetical protein